MTRRSGFGEVSKGAKIGIMVGVVVLVIVIGFFMFNSSSAPAFSITSGNTYQIKNVNTGKYLIPSGTATLSDNPSNTPWTVTSSGDGYILTSNGLTLVIWGDISTPSINAPGVYAVRTAGTEFKSFTNVWKVNITNGNTATIQNIAKINGGGVSWLSIINDAPKLVASQDSNSTWTLE